MIVNMQFGQVDIHLGKLNISLLIQTGKLR